MADQLIASTNGFSLGIDWSQPPENIDIQSVIQAYNCEFDRTDGALRTVQGVTTLYDAGKAVDSLYYDVYRQRWYYSSGTELYTTDFIISAKLGDLTGVSIPCYHSFGGDVLIASGGKLQTISGAGTLSTVAASPTCEFVSSNAGSVLVASIYGHRLSWSAIGDYTTWAVDSNDASSGQYVEVGYKDQGHIIAVDFLSKAIIVYKDYGKVYQVIGNPHDKTLSVYPLSETGFCSGSAVNVDDRSYYLGDVGLMSFLPTDTYANIQPFETGTNVNAYLSKQTNSDSRMWHVQSRKQIWIKPAKGEQTFLYHYIPRYSDGRGVFTSRSFVYDLHDVVSLDKDVYIAYGNKIGKLNDQIDTDDGAQIKTSIISGNRLAQRLFLLLMSYSFVSHNVIDGYGSIGISNKKEKQITFASKGFKLFTDVRVLYTADDLLTGSDYTKIFKVGGGALRNVQIKIFVSKGAISLRQFNYNYEEV